MIYFIFLVLWVLVASPISKRISQKNWKKIYCWMVFIPLVLLMGLRSRYVGGVDTDWYFIPNFQKICNYSMEHVLAYYGRDGKDFVFYFMTKLFTYINQNPYTYIFVISLVITSSYCLFVYRYSQNPVISFIVYFALGYYTAGFQLLRQVLAVSVLLYAYPHLLKRKPIPFVLLVLLASGFHSTALIFLIAYPLVNMKIGWKQWGAMTGVLAMCYLARGTLNQILSAMFEENVRYSKYVESDYGVQLSVVGIVLLLFVYVVCYCVSAMLRKSIILDTEVKVLFNLSALSICTMSLIVVIGEFYRVSMLFGIFNTLLVPTVLTEYYKKGQAKNIAVLITLATCSLLLVYFFGFRLGNDDLSTYMFFWND